MSASAQEPVDPASASDRPSEDALPEDAVDAVEEGAPLEEAPVDDDQSSYAPKAAQQRRPILASWNLDDTPASVGAETPELSWPPWQQPQRAPAGDTATGGGHSGAQPADKGGGPADDSKPAQARYATGLILIAT